MIAHYRIGQAVDGKDRGQKLQPVTNPLATIVVGVKGGHAEARLARHSKPELTANIYTHLSLKDTAVEVEKLASVPTESSPTVEDQQEGDFGPAPGPAPGPARSAIQADLSHEPAIPVNLLAQEKSPVFAGKTGLFESDADGTRTRNLRIDSPGL